MHCDDGKPANGVGIATEIASICYRIYSICHRLYRAAEIWGALYICVSCGERTVAECVTLCVAEPRFTILEPASPSDNYCDGETTRTTVLAVHMALLEIDRAFETIKLKHGTERRVCTVLRLRLPRKSCTTPGARRRPNCVSDSSNVMIATRYNILVALKASLYHLLQRVHYQHTPSSASGH